MNFDTNKAVIELRNHGFTQQQAEAAINAIVESQFNIATKNDVHAFKKEVVNEIKHAQNLTQIFGALLCAGVITLLIKVFTI